MQELLRWLASSRGVDVEPGTSLRLELSAWPEGGLGFLVLLGLAAVIAVVVYSYRRDGRNLEPWQRALLVGLRCVAVLAAVLILLEPNLVVVKREQRQGQTLVLLDVSESMDQVDSFRREGVTDLRAGWRDLGVESPDAQSRFDLVRALIDYDDQRLVNELAEHNEVLVYGMSSGAEPIPIVVTPGGEDPETPARSYLDLSAVRPDGGYTNIGGAVRAILERSRGAAIASVVILSDGRRNMGPRGAEVARLLRQRAIPHTFVLGVGDPSETQTVEIVSISAPEKAFQSDPFRITAQVSSQGYDSAEVVVRLLRTPPAGEAEVIGTKAVHLDRDAPDATVQFDQITANQAGVHTYAVEIAPPDAAPDADERHVAYAPIEVLGEQTVVLLIAGGPSHEYRILRDTLTRDQTVELRCWLSSADPDFPQDGNVSIDSLPVDRRGLEQIDVVLLIDPDSTKLTREFCELLANHVVEDGGGLWWVRERSSR